MSQDDAGPPVDAFHLSRWSDDLVRARHFYETIGCRVTRERDSWVDFDFFGHQLTIHQSRQPRAPAPGPGRDSLDHFGLVLDRPRWRALLARMEALGLPFRAIPKDDGERGKFVVVDPDGVGLEFKYDMAGPRGCANRG